MRTFVEKYRGGCEIPEDRYKVDVIVLEKYQSFSAELLRLALLGIAVYGFLVSNIVLELKADSISAFGGGYLSPVVLLVGAAAFSVSAVTALAHRFYSSDCLTHFVRILRLRDGEFDQKLAQEERSLETDLNRCKYFLLISCIALVIGASLVAFSFSLVLFQI